MDSFYVLVFFYMMGSLITTVVVSYLMRTADDWNISTSLASGIVWPATLAMVIAWKIERE